MGPERTRAADKPHMVNCPQCGTPAPFSAANPYRPFCSERCKLIDLGQWASEAYRVPVDEQEAERKDEPPRD
jgi:endogenous inhibitor of DNA gyrase (YacG/DUF329 family)